MRALKPFFCSQRSSVSFAFFYTACAHRWYYEICLMYFFFFLFGNYSPLFLYLNSERFPTKLIFFLASSPYAHRMLSCVTFIFVCHIKRFFVFCEISLSKKVQFNLKEVERNFIFLNYLFLFLLFSMRL